MNPTGPSSFIPKSPSRTTVKPRGVRKIYVFTYLSLVLFFGTLIASAGTFFFDITTTAQLADQKAALASARNQFSDTDLNRLRVLESRIENAKLLLGTHVSVADILEALETSTISTVQLTGLEYSRTDFGGITLALSARTASLNDARFQRDIYASNEVLRDAGIVDPKYSSRAEELGGSFSSTDSTITFTLESEFAVSDIPFTAPETAAESESATSTGESTSPETDGDVSVSDETTS
jgi:hypothetical protein